MTSKRGADAPKWPMGVVANLEELAHLRGEGERLRLEQSHRVGTLLAGSHRSPFRGQGMEFAEVREYHPGDDPRSIDWKVTARTGSVHTKLFHEERERPALFLVDQGASMFFGSRNCLKSVQAARLAALLGFSALGSGDRVGGIVLRSHSLSAFKALRSRRRWFSFLRTLADATHRLAEQQIHAPSTEGELGLDVAMRRLLAFTTPGCQVVIISDFYRLGPEFLTSLRLLSRRTALQLVHVFDPLERQAPPPSRYRVSDGKHLASCDTSSKQVRDAWGRSFLERQVKLQDWCATHRVHYRAASTHQTATEILSAQPQKLAL